MSAYGWYDHVTQPQDSPHIERLAHLRRLHARHVHRVTHVRDRDRPTPPDWGERLVVAFAVVLAAGAVFGACMAHAAAARRAAAVQGWVEFQRMGLEHTPPTVGGDELSSHRPSLSARACSAPGGGGMQGGNR